MFFKLKKTTIEQVDIIKGLKHMLLEEIKKKLDEKISDLNINTHECLREVTYITNKLNLYI